MNAQMIVTYIVVDMLCGTLAVSMSYHLNCDFGSEFEVKSLRRALLSYCGFLAFGLIGILMENQYIVYVEAIDWIANIISLLLLLLLFYFWFIFATTRLHNRFPPKWVLSMARIPLIVVTLLCVTSPLTGWIFGIDAAGTYQRGPFFSYLYIPIVAYGFLVLVEAIVVGVREKQQEKRHHCLIIAVFFVYPAVAGVLQLYLANMPIMAPAIVTSFFLVFINIQSSQIYNDALTGLNNRRRAYNFLEEQLSVAGEEKPVMVYLMDVDSFKQINDQYGHGEGDRTLKAVAMALIKLCQQHHLFVARYGGDEFIMVGTWRCLEEPETIITAFNKTLREQCEENQFSWEVSMSIGYALAQDGKETTDEVIRRADQSLYEQKRRHHNKV